MSEDVAIQALVNRLSEWKHPAELGPQTTAVDVAYAVADLVRALAAAEGSGA